MKISNLEFHTVKLPFRFAFKHSLAARNFSENIIAKATVSSGKGNFIGWGEGVPRDYVTGETIDQSLHNLRRSYAPRLIGKEINSLEELTALLHNQFYEFGLDIRSAGAAWCALELSILDGVSKASNISLAQWLVPPRQEAVTDGIRYGGVIPFASNISLLKTMLWFYRLSGFQTVKLKVGKNHENDLERLKITRSIMGNSIKIRVDANCAWSVEETIRFAEQARKYNISSIEQPVLAHDLDGLSKISRLIPDQIVADESLCTIAQAYNLASERICSGFNIRISKVGGLLAAAQISKIAELNGIACHLGAQVGESGILSSAARIFAAIERPFENYEGSQNFFLLKHDLTKENLTTGYGGIGKLLKGTGLGITANTKSIEATINDTGTSGEASHRNALARF